MIATESHTHREANGRFPIRRALVFSVKSVRRKGNAPAHWEVSGKSVGILRFRQYFVIAMIDCFQIQGLNSQIYVAEVVDKIQLDFGGVILRCGKHCLVLLPFPVQ